ncbi:MAG: thioredoxin domain-containing protein, partial [Pedobacter sp.]
MSNLHSEPNNLINASSPYLLQHAYNPVQWYEWGNEALEKAKVENKLILVSIGYSACHWCHVMERESFENFEVAEVMNKHFVCIKVDREERPDIDQIYMYAIQLMTGSGGWPLNCICLPDQR